MFKTRKHPWLYCALGKVFLDSIPACKKLQFRIWTEELPTFFLEAPRIVLLLFLYNMGLDFVLQTDLGEAEQIMSSSTQLAFYISSRQALFGTSQAILVLLSLSRNELGLYMVKTSLNAVNYHLRNELNSAFQLGMWIAMYILWTFFFNFINCWFGLFQ